MCVVGLVRRAYAYGYVCVQWTKYGDVENIDNVNHLALLQPVGENLSSRFLMWVDIVIEWNYRA